MASATPAASPTPAASSPTSAKPHPKSPSPSCYTSSASITSKSKPARPPRHPPAANSYAAPAAAPIADKLHRFVLAERQRHLPGSDVAQAINYTLNQWHKILVCFEDGALELDTNLVENMIRPTKLGMKNWMFFGSLEAGENNALIYTLLANCRAQGLDPEDYLVEVLKRLPHDATPEQASALTPARIAAERKAKAETKAEAEQVA
ncbi:transposase [Akkermansiaceae bacterium]|nr:transposase [Akkermansiaceae bacterium]